MKEQSKATLLCSLFFYCLESTTLQGYALLAKRLSSSQCVLILDLTRGEKLLNVSVPSLLHCLITSSKGTGPDEYSAF